MADAMGILRREHMDMARLLDLMDREVSRFQRGVEPDFGIVRGIVGYFLSYPDLYHHPKEDVIFEKLRLRAPDEVAVVEGLLTGHQELASLTRRFATAAVDQMVRPKDVPREWFASLARDFVESNRRHMALEEEGFFPLVLHSLTDADWAELDSDLSSAGEVEGQFGALRDAIIDLDRARAGGHEAR